MVPDTVLPTVRPPWAWILPNSASEMCMSIAVPSPIRMVYATELVRREGGFRVGSELGLGEGADER